MDRIAAMTAFVRVVEAGSFTKAADTLDVTNATVTRLVQGLEQELGIRLLHRTTRSVTLTAEGALYYERVARLLADLEDIESAARQARSRPSGKVRMETAAALASSVIVPQLASFYAAYPEVEVELSIGTKHADLVAEGIDCALRAGEPTEQSMVARKIGSFRFATCASPELVRRHGTPEAPSDLQALPTIGMVSARGGRALPFRFFQGDDAPVEVPLQHHLVVNDVNAYVNAAKAGLGVIQAPSYAVQQAVSDGELVLLLPAWRGGPVPMYILYAQNRYLSAKVRVFIDWTIAMLQQHPGLQ